MGCGDSKESNDKRPPRPSNKDCNSEIWADSHLNASFDLSLAEEFDDQPSPSSTSPNESMTTSTLNMSTASTGSGNAASLTAQRPSLNSALYQKYTLSEKVLGRGSYGTVFEGFSLASNEKVAVKVIPKQSKPLLLSPLLIALISSVLQS